MVSYYSGIYLEHSHHITQFNEAKICAHLFDKANKDILYFTVVQEMSWKSYQIVKGLGHIKSEGLLLNIFLKSKDF